MRSTHEIGRGTSGTVILLLVAALLAIAPGSALGGEPAELGACCLADGTCATLTREACENPVFCRGDSNCDGQVDFFDIDPFVLALNGEEAFQDVYPDCAWLNSDANGDGLVDFFDIDPLVGALGTTCLGPGTEGFWSGAGSVCSAAICRIDCNQNGVHDADDLASGTSADCNLDRVPDECQDCNSDGLGDVCQISAGALADINSNWIPDACEFDCDQNGLPDSYEIAIGLQTDCDGNGAPDACEIVVGIAGDCNADLIPDNCQLAGNDCNSNDRPDDCDPDADGDGVPDDCEPPPAPPLAPSPGEFETDGRGGEGGRDGVTIDLDIFNGLAGSCPSVECGGQAVPEDEETSKGAVTLANLNDTNADGIVDRDQDVVITADARGRNEVDLMRLILRRPSNFDPNSRAELKSIGGPVRLWVAPTKVEEQPIPFSFATHQLPIELWVEATEYSNVPRTIGLELLYKVNGSTMSRDEVRATAVWAERTLVKVERGLGGTTNDIPLDLNDSGLRGLMLSTEAADGTRFGLGTQRKQGTVDLSTGGRILIEYLVWPDALGTLPVRFDVTRGVYAQDYRIVSGLGATELWTPEFKRLFPENRVPPENVERSNDDTNDTDEDNAPTGGHIYGWDTPSQVRGARSSNVETAFWVRRDMFREFVRVRVGPGQSFQNGNGTLQGSRASDFTAWHYVDYLKRDATGQWTPDASATGVSAPVRIGGGNGAAIVRPLSGAVLEGFVATYDSTVKTWALDGTQSEPVSDAAVGIVPAGTVWKLRVPGRIELTITQGAVAFNNGDRFTFSVFPSTRKANANGLGAIDPSGTP